MSQELKPNTEEAAALDRIDAELKGTGTNAVTAAGAAALDLGDLCKKYQSLKGSIEILLKFIKKIPGVGGKIAAVIEFLMGLADIACPV
jgi:hypothetical protein